MWTSDFVILEPYEESPENYFLADGDWFDEFSDFLVSEISETVVMLGLKVNKSGYEESYGMQNFLGDYNIVVAKTFKTDEPFLKKKPSGFSWADTWEYDAKFMWIDYRTDGSLIPDDYYLADQTWINGNWKRVNATGQTGGNYDGGYLEYPSADAEPAPWEFGQDTYKTIRPGSFHVNALIVQASFDG
jgi:hypothetical protein